MHGNLLERFGFPRIPQKKKYCWKKMNFTTNLPKRNPEVIYIVASSYLAASISSEHSCEFRMHVAVLANGESPYLLCHIRRVSGEENPEKSTELGECFEANRINFYRLFMHLHNNYHLTLK